MTRARFFITDVFTNRKYGGNPLATFVDCESLSDQEMQQIAKEINFSETTFITSRQPRDGGYDVRIFTPNAEVEFAGHPTLGTSYVIREILGLTTAKEITLNLGIGKIPVSFTETTNSLRLWMKQRPPEFRARREPHTLADVLGIDVTDIALDSPIEEVSTGFPTLIVPLTSLAALRRIKVNKDRYFELIKDAWAKIILVFCREGYEKEQALGVRVFADYYGIAEDAATGSSNGSLAAYLSLHKLMGSSTIDIHVGQGYEMARPSTLALRTRGGPEPDVIEVSVGGGVVAVAEGLWG